MIRLFMQGDHKPGDRLPAEIELARQFNVGRGAVREALKALSIVGLVKVERGRGTFVRERSDFLVRPISMGLEADIDIHFLVEARKLIEVEVAGLAAERANPDHIEPIEESLQRMKRAMEAGEVIEFLRADMDFHFGIVNATGNPILGQFLTLIRNMMREWILVLLSKRDVALEAFQQHQHILDAIRKREPSAARKAMDLHLVAMGRHLVLANRFPAKKRRAELFKAKLDSACTSWTEELQPGSH
jgi:GntR family transcriptional repressor for pyruvate dehydrogenase complex